MRITINGREDGWRFRYFFKFIPHFLIRLENKSGKGIEMPLFRFKIMNILGRSNKFTLKVPAIE
jgi:hypothetical protein